MRTLVFCGRTLAVRIVPKCDWMTSGGCLVARWVFGRGPRLVACILLLPEHAEVLSGLLRNLTTNSNVPGDLEALKQPKGFPRPEPADPWLPHVEAAKYLGISKSTLYHYAHQERIECRKISGRLEYRQSKLENLKQEQIRPARVRLHSSGIIPSTLNSGK